MRLWRRRTDQDFGAELDAHVALETDQLIADGVAASEARDLARRRLGNRTRVRETYYESHRWVWLDQLVMDVRVAARGIRRYPVAFFVAVLSLGTGIGAATITLVLRNALYTAPPPLYANATELTRISLSTPQRARDRVPAGLYRQWLADPVLADAIGAGRGSTARTLRLDDRQDAAAVHEVTGTLFSRLGVAPAVGTGFTVATHAEPEALLSHAVWQRLFNGRSDVVGRTLWVEGAAHSVAGVMPARFWFGRMDSPIWTRFDPAVAEAATPLYVAVRRPPGMSATDLQARLERGLDRYRAELPSAARDLRILVEPWVGTPFGQEIGPMVVLLLTSAVVLTLVIACTNIAVLMMAQWTSRERELGIRASLGGARARIVRTLVVESSLLALAGAALGVVVTLALREWVQRTTVLAPMFDLSIAPGVWAQIAAVTAAAGMLTGLAPAMLETRRLQHNPMAATRASDQTRQRWRHALVVFEIATTVALLVVTTAMLSSYERAVNVAPGFDPAPILSLRVEHAKRIPHAALLARVRQVGGVELAEVATVVPFFSGSPERTLADLSQSRSVPAEFGAVGPAYFATMGVRLEGGRAFTEADHAGAPRVAIVNPPVVAALWPGQTGLGQVLRIGGVAHEVVGVVAGFANNALRPVRPAVFVPVAQQTPFQRLQIVVRAAGDPAPLVQTLRREIEASGVAAVTSASTMRQIITIIGEEIAVGTMPMVPLVATGLLLTAAGIYAVLALAVSRRSTELAVRMAVGATRGDVMRLVGEQAMRLVTLGAVFGVGVTFALTRAAQGRGGTFDSPDWATFVVPVAILGVVASAATWIPTRRAARVDPATLLRLT